MNYPPYNPYQSIMGQQFQQPMMTNQYQNLQYQAAVQPQQPTVQGISGRIVNTESEVAPNEVPNDNSVGYYPSADGRVIWAKTWNSNGGISTKEYILNDVQPEAPIDPLELVIARLTAIEAALQDLKPKTRTRKAADDE